MATVSFYLRDKNTNPSAIMGRLYYDNKEYAFSSGYSIDPKKWNQKTNRAIGRSSDILDINANLTQKSADILLLYNELKTHGDVSNKIIRAKLNNVEIVDENSLYGYIEKVIGRRERQKIINNNGKDFRLYKYKSVYCRLVDFAKINYTENLDFKDINLDFYTKYVEWLKSEHNYSENTIGAEIKILKRFLNLATVEGVNSQLSFKSGEFKVSSIAKKHIYITDDELNSLYNYKLTGHLERTRDIFILGCRTGLRVSDYHRCTDDAVANSLICIDETTKTGEPVYIPMHWQVKGILSKYNGIPPKISDQKLNKYLKELGKELDFSEKVKDTRARSNKGGTCPRYELITTHTARHN